MEPSTGVSYLQKQIQQKIDFPVLFVVMFEVAES